MKISWKITKKRGNWRPVLEYTCTKEKWEIDLAIPGGGETEVKIETAWSASERVFDGQDERSREGSEKNYLSLLSYPASHEKTHSWRHKLPWKPAAKPQYPEIKQAFNDLMRVWEAEVKKALASEEITETGEVEYSPEAKKEFAPYVAKQKMTEKGEQSYETIQ